MILAKLTARLSRAVLITSLIATGLVPAMGLLAPAAASAAACTGSAALLSGSLLTLAAVPAAPDSAVKMVGFEYSPQTAWTTGDNLYAGVTFADSGCVAFDSGLSYTLDGTKKLTINFNDNTRNSAFVVTTDYTNLFSGVTFSSTSNTLGKAEYTIPTVDVSVPLLVSVDLLTDPGWVNVYLKVGSGVNNLLISFKAAAATASFQARTNSSPRFNYGDFDSLFSACDKFTGARQGKVRILYDGTPTTLTTVSDGFCTSFDKSSYDSVTKTATLGYDTAGTVVNRSVTTESTYRPGGGVPVITSTLTTTEANGVFSPKDVFTTGADANQKLYITTSTTEDGKSIAKGPLYPIAGFNADMSAADLDLRAKAVTYDVTDTAAKRAAFAHNLGNATKDGSFSLYVPYKVGDTFVGICAGAASLDAVSDKCTGIYYVKDGQTKTSKDTKSIPVNRSVKASIITVGTKKFWQIDGLTGTGAFATTLATDPATGIAFNTTTTPVVIVAIMGTLALAFVARRMAVKK